MHLRNALRLVPLALLLMASSPARADTAAFDLDGPAIDLWVLRGGRTLPISQVPNLYPGDRIRIHAALPSNQSVHYLLVAVFLRGATNPPPEKWFTRAETWRKKSQEEGILITVPEGAEQAAIFLAPETSGDFPTLRSAVRGRPGSFVRAIQDLQQASLDRSRLDAYLDAMKRVAPETNATALHDETVLLARSLNIRLDEDCYRKHPEQQAACLTQRSENLVLNDGHSRSMVGALTQGPASDLIGQITYTPTAGSGYFSPYVGAIVDLGRILDSLHTAQYQYIPALGLPKKDQLQLKLNTPPSFHNPKSVIVAALPAVKSEAPPPLRALEPEQPTCLQNSPLVLPVAGAPLVFSTDLLHDLVLHVERPGEPALDLPAKADAMRGGFVVDTAGLSGKTAGKNGPIEGVLRGFWGFQAFTGPTFKLRSATPTAWSIPANETVNLVAGQEHTFQLRGQTAACVKQVTLLGPRAQELKTAWKVAKPDELEIRIPAASAVPGTLALRVKQEGAPKPDEVRLQVYAETARLDRLVIIPGVQQAILHGTHLEEVARVEVNGLRFTPGRTPAPGQGQLPFVAENADATAGLTPDTEAAARAILKDGRQLETRAIVESPRPSVTLLSKRVEGSTAPGPVSVYLTNENELPLDGKLRFSLKAGMPKVFARGEKIEISVADNPQTVTLSIAEGQLTLQDPHTAVATLEPLRSFGKSAFGQLRFRPVDDRGANGDWQPLAMLVRLPSLQELRCPDDPDEPCTLRGTNLFLLDSVATDPEFVTRVTVPEGFVESSLRVPRPRGATLYLKLRDDPKDVNVALFPAATPARQ